MKRLIRHILKEESENPIKERFIRSAKSIPYIIESNVDSFYEAYCRISENLPKFTPDILINYVKSHFSENAISQKLINSYKSILSQNEQNLSIL